MAYVLQPVDQPILYVPDNELPAYLAAGWTQATAAQIAAYHAVDPYRGLQTAPPAPLKDNLGRPLPPQTKHVR